MSKGDHIKVTRAGGAYTHHGIDMGDGTVIHFSGEIADLGNSAEIERVPSEQFANGGKIKVVEYAKKADADEICRRAEKCLGEKGYNPISNNCEHFAEECRTGEHVSDQANTVVSTGVGVAGTSAATYGAISVIGASGAVAGMSGAGIMSGLATVGGVVGGGAAAGVAALATAPAVIGTLATGSVLRDDERLPQQERDSRKAGRVAAAVGGAVGTVGTVATISATGAVAGLSAAGITSGLAAVGGVVGGGMAGGAAICVAAPAAAAAAVGYGAYRLWNWATKK
ncbi:MAG: lecithin retinol acyltransferase family protein [Candidatus Riflebacteria bacterium]|nr:lecithin retinol acyltransferase family protein [Candidatus Riflebacteria bacterium]